MMLAEGEEIEETIGSKKPWNEFDTPEKCKDVAEAKIRRLKAKNENIPFDYRVVIEPFEVDVNEYKLFKRRQKTSMGDDNPKSPCDDKGVPVFDNRREPVFGDWFACDEDVSYRWSTRDRCSSQSICPKGYLFSDEIEKGIREDRANEGKAQSGRAKKIAYEYDVRGEPDFQTRHVCKIAKKKARDLPSNMVSARMDRDDLQAFPENPFLVSVEGLRLKIPSVEPLPEGRSPKIRNLSFIDLDGNEITRRVIVPNIKFKTVMHSMGTGQGMQSFKQSLRKGNVFLESAFFRAMMDERFSSKESYGSGQTYEKKIEHGGTVYVCRAETSKARSDRYSSVSTILPYATHEKVLDSPYKHDEYGARAIPTIYKPFVRIQKGEHFKEDVRIAPRAVVEECKKAVERAMSASAIRVRNFPDGSLTLEEYEDLSRSP